MGTRSHPVFQYNNMERVFMTREELAQYLSADWRNKINYRVDNNPTDTYQLIKMNWGTEFQSLASGSETTEGSREMMYKFLVRKAEESDNPNGIATFIWAAIPHNFDTNNWTNQIK